MAEVTFRPGSYLAKLNKEDIIGRVQDGLDRTGLIRKKDIMDTVVRKFRYAYVIYDLNHKRNVKSVLGYLSDIGISCCGRFAEFEYLNMDMVIEHSRRLAGELNNER